MTKTNLETNVCLTEGIEILRTHDSKWGRDISPKPTSKRNFFSVA